MATRTFVADGTSRAWSLTTTWAEGAVPTASDDVVFSTNVASSTLVIDGTSGSPSLCRSIDTTNYTRTITMGATAVLQVGTSTAGAFKLTAGMTFSPASGSTFKFVSMTTGNNITWAGYAVSLLVFDGVSGGWQFQDNLVAGLGTPNLTLTNGSLDTNGKAVWGVGGGKLSSNNSNTRSLTLGASSVTLVSTAGTNWDIGTSTGMTLSAASSTITLTPAAQLQTFAGGGLTYGTVSSTLLTTGTITFTGANTFGTLTTSMGSTTKTTTSGYIFPAGVTQTVTGTYTAAGNTLSLRNFLYSSTLGTAATISAGTFAITNTDLRDITKAGAGSGNISATSSSTGNGDCGGNTGWTFQAPRSVYMKTAVSVNWSAANWYTTSGGSTAAVPPLPLCHDTNAVFDVNSVTAGSKTITIDQPRISGSIWTGVANTPTLTANAIWETYGGLILGTVSISSDSHGVSFLGRGSNTFNQNGQTWPNSKPITIDLATGTLTMASNFSSLAAGTFLTMNSGTYAGGGFTFNYGGNSTQAGGTISGFGASTIGGSWTQSGGTFTLGGTQTFGGAVAISGGTLDMNGFGETGATSLVVSGSGTLNLSGQFLCSTTITVSGGTVANTGASGELKTTGNSAITFSGGTSSPMKITSTNASGPNIIVSGTGTLSMPASSSINWTGVGIFEVSGATAIFTTAGPITGTANTLTIGAAGGSFTFGS